jgi:hypothetical protein
VRSDDGSSVTKDFVAGESRLIGADELPAVHDLENVGETPLRFITVELLRGLRI